MAGALPIPNITRPDPDPTTLTTDVVLREGKWLRELVEARLAAVDKELSFMREAFERLPQIRHEAIDRLQQLHEEKFKSIATQFIERDTRVEQTAKDSKVAVDAALSAAKEAVTEQNKSTALAIAKSEAAFLKQLDQLVLLLDTKTQALTKEVDEIRIRQTLIESRTIVTKEMGSDGRALVFSLVAAIAAIAGLIFGILGMIRP